jgi:transmembrane sensor
MIVDDDLIAKFLSGEASPEEAIALHEWLAVPANKARFDEMSSTWDQANPSKAFKTVNKDRAWKKVKPTRNLWLPVGIAASLLLVISVFVIRNIAPESVQLTASTLDSTKHVSLADNSNVILYKNTSIEYSKKFDRKIKLLSGEAFFKIEKDTINPFIVHTSFAEIRVVGTQFNVIIKDNTISVGVEEGLVQIITATDSVYIGKGAAAFVRSGEPVRKARMDENTWAYATKKLIFKDTPMSEVIESLEKTYSINISVSNDDINKCRFTATFEKDNVGKILLLVSETLNSTLKQNGQEYTLEGGDGCP